MHDGHELDQRQPLLDQVGLLGARGDRAGDPHEAARRHVQRPDVGLGARTRSALAELGVEQQVAHRRRAALARERKVDDRVGDAVGALRANVRCAPLVDVGSQTPCRDTRLADSPRRRARRRPSGSRAGTGRAPPTAPRPPAPASRPARAGRAPRSAPRAASAGPPPSPPPPRSTPRRSAAAPRRSTAANLAATNRSPQARRRSSRPSAFTRCRRPTASSLPRPARSGRNTAGIGFNVIWRPLGALSPARLARSSTADEAGAWLLLYIGARLAAWLIAVALVGRAGLGGVNPLLLLYGPASTLVAGAVAARAREPVGVGDRFGADAAVRAALRGLAQPVLSDVAVEPGAACDVAVSAARRLARRGRVARRISGGDRRRPCPGPAAARVDRDAGDPCLAARSCSWRRSAYAAEALRRLAVERTTRERLAIEAERRRIAWELHDSAKQRLHAAHLLVTLAAGPRAGRAGGNRRAGVGGARVGGVGHGHEPGRAALTARGAAAGRRHCAPARRDLARGPPRDHRARSGAASCRRWSARTPTGSRARRSPTRCGTPTRRTSKSRSRGATGDLQRHRPRRRPRAAERASPRRQRPARDGESRGHDRRSTDPRLAAGSAGTLDRTRHPPRPRTELPMIRVVVVDDHPALRAGLQTVLDSEPGIVFAGESSGSEESVWPICCAARPDLVLLDYHLPRGDGLQLCYRIKQRCSARAVIVLLRLRQPRADAAARSSPRPTPCSTRASPHASCSRSSGGRSRARTLLALARARRCCASARAHPRGRTAR